MTEVMKDAGKEGIPIVSTGGSPDGYQMLQDGIEAANMTYMPLNAQETNDILDSMSGNFEKIINAYLNSAN